MYNIPNQPDERSEAVRKAKFYKIAVNFSGPYGGLRKERIVHMMEDVNPVIDALAKELKRDLAESQPPILFDPNRAKKR